MVRIGKRDHASSLSSSSDCGAQDVCDCSFSEKVFWGPQRNGRCLVFTFFAFGLVLLALQCGVCEFDAIPHLITAKSDVRCRRTKVFHWHSSFLLCLTASCAMSQRKARGLRRTLTMETTNARTVRREKWTEWIFHRPPTILWTVIKPLNNVRICSSAAELSFVTNTLQCAGCVMQRTWK